MCVHIHLPLPPANTFDHDIFGVQSHLPTLSREPGTEAGMSTLSGSLACVRICYISWHAKADEAVQNVPQYQFQTVFEHSKINDQPQQCSRDRARVKIFQ